MSKQDLDGWFVSEVLPLESALMRFLRRHWRDEAELLDLRQETYARVYEAARNRLPGNTRALLFTTARNLIIDRVRRAQVVSMETIADFTALPVVVDEPSSEEKASSRQELKALQAALETLPPRCREILVLRKIRGRSQRDVAAALGLAEATVEKQVAKAVRRLADALYGSGGVFADTTSDRARATKEGRHE